VVYHTPDVSSDLDKPYVLYDTSNLQPNIAILLSAVDHQICDSAADGRGEETVITFVQCFYKAIYPQLSMENKTGRFISKICKHRKKSGNLI
jgi:hypothetical protein